ncbi:MAG: Rpn family recombination-promoting nuclease/putative transposase, partial [Treponema sp.]|nr:Rpn family recombination-promoting nuclease/putative transposase [Treponema sp.]
ITIRDITYLQTQREVKDSVDSKGVRLDVYASDPDRVFDIEMQTTRKKELLLRARYYAASMDIDSCYNGDTYKLLKDNYVIFICMFDPFGKGLPVYTYRTTCQEDGSLQDDRTVKLPYNVGAYKKIEDAEVRALFEYMYRGTVNGIFAEQLDKQVKKAKTNSEYRRSYMTLSMMLHDARNEGKDIGIAIGRTQGKEQNQMEMMKLFQMLRSQNRMDDLDRAITDKEYLQSLLDKMNE